jgi:NTP pyrophosphatase (non-canonical NTP hydrolase)
MNMKNSNPAKNETRSISLHEYMLEIEKTDTLPPEVLSPVLMGLFGEVGGIMATAKKLHREENAYPGYRQAVEEEFGDTLWYFTTLCRRLGVSVGEIFSEVANGADYTKIMAASDNLHRPIAQLYSSEGLSSLDETLLKLSQATAALMSISSLNDTVRALLIEFAVEYVRALQVAQVNFSKVVHQNITKTIGRFVKPDKSLLPIFDGEFRTEERLPDRFEITITERASGQSYLQWNGVFIGDPLTDNILDPDGYRFHDVFHFAHAAILHWSPTFRALIKHKRKSDSVTDEAQDGGRAIVVEEGLTAWIFSRAKEQEFFKDQEKLSFDLLKTVEEFVSGYEVEACPLKLWERAILDGYRVFLQVRDNNGGIVIGNRSKRTIEFRPLKGD